MLQSMEGGVDIEGISGIAQLRSLLSFLRMITIVFLGRIIAGNEAVLGLVKGNDKKCFGYPIGQLTLQKSKRWWWVLATLKERITWLPYVADSVYVAVVKDPAKMIDGKLGRGFYYIVEYIDRYIAKTKSLGLRQHWLKQAMTIPSRLEVERMREDIWIYGSLLFVGRFFQLRSSSAQSLSFTTNKFLKGTKTVTVS